MYSGVKYVVGEEDIGDVDEVVVSMVEISGQRMEMDSRGFVDDDLGSGSWIEGEENGDEQIE